MVTVKNAQNTFGTNVKHFTKIDMETRLNTSGSKVACFGEVHLLQFVPLEKLVFIRSCQIHLFNLCLFLTEKSSSKLRHSQFVMSGVTVRRNK